MKILIMECNGISLLNCINRHV